MVINMKEEEAKVVSNTEEEEVRMVSNTEEEEVSTKADQEITKDKQEIDMVMNLSSTVENKCPRCQYRIFHSNRAKTQR